MAPRVVVTGFGPVRSFNPESYASTLGAEIADFDAAAVLKRMDAGPD